MLEWIRKRRQHRYIQALVNRGLKLGRNVFLNDGFFLDPSHCELITIEDNVVFGPLVCILAHDASSKKVIGATKVKPIILKQNCFIGARSIILPGSTVGRNSIVGAGSVVSSSIPDNELWAGVPAKRLMAIEDYKKKLLEISSTEIDFETYSSSYGARIGFRDQLTKLGVTGLIR